MKINLLGTDREVSFDTVVPLFMNLLTLYVLWTNNFYIAKYIKRIERKLGIKLRFAKKSMVFERIFIFAYIYLTTKSLNGALFCLILTFLIQE